MPNDPKVSWRPASLTAIQIDPNQNAWHAGHVNDVLPRGDAVLIGANAGGVWLVASNGSAVTLTDLDNPNIECLAEGSNGPDHYFAGCVAYSNPSSVLYETDVTDPAPLYSWRAVPGLPPDAGTIYRIGVFKDIKVIVIACAGGIYWSSIPTGVQPQGCGCLLAFLGLFIKNPTQGSYAWSKAQGLPAGSYYGLALGPNHTVAVGSLGPGGIFHGSWQGSPSQLVMSAATINGLDPTKMSTTSLASCATQPNNMYAVSSAASSLVLGVLRSVDGGQTWNICGVTLAGAPINPNTSKVWDITTACGAQGQDWNNCIAVSPNDPNTVAFGWEYPFLSTDAGQTWKGIGVTWNSAHTAWNVDVHMHADQHAVCFDPTVAKRMYFGNDGGVSKSDDLGQTLQSDLSRQVLNLEFYSTCPLRMGVGTMSASTLTSGLIAGGTQDNGVLYCLAGEDVNGVLTGQAPWQGFVYGDGGGCQFMGTGRLLYSRLDAIVSGAFWSVANQDLNDLGPVPVTGIKGPLNGIFESVKNPGWKNANDELMYAVAGSGANLYGVFSKGDGSDLHLEQLANLPLLSTQYITGLASLDGTRVFAGTQEGRIFTFDPATKALQEGSGLPPAAIHRSVSRIVAQSSQRAYLIYNVQAFNFAPGQGCIYRTTDGVLWTPLGGGLPNENFFAMDIDPTTQPPTVFAATDGIVYDSYDGGDSWGPASLNLPVRPHCADMRFVTQQDGVSFLYLSTFGHSVWRAQLHP